jgi:hypothetical protein
MNVLGDHWVYAAITVSVFVLTFMAVVASLAGYPALKLHFNSLEAPHGSHPRVPSARHF